MRPYQVIFIGISLCLATTAHATLTVSVHATKNVSCGAGVCNATARNAVLNVSDLVGMLSTGDVTLVSGAQARDIEIGTALTWASGHRLTLDAFRGITFDKPVAVAGSGGLTIKTNDGGANGDFRFFGKGHVEFSNPTSSLIINGNTYLLANSIKQIVALRTPRGTGNSFIALAKSLNLWGKAYNASPIPWYQGTFEGLGNTIYGLHISDSTHACVGLFGCEHNLTPSVRDIGLLSVSILGRVVAQQSVGTLAGYTTGDIISAYATGTVQGDGTHDSVGGLVGTGVANAIRYSHADVRVWSGGDNEALGSLVGSLIGFCVEGTCSGIIDQSYATGEVMGSAYNLTGGLVGFNIAGAITNCYATGAVSAAGYAGGLIGWSQDNDAEQSIAVVENSYATGGVTGANGYAGGFLGHDEAAGHRSNLYWDIETSGFRNGSQGAGFPASDPGITGLSTAQLLSALPAGFDEAIWAQDAKINNGYPYLIANPPPK